MKFDRIGVALVGRHHRPGRRPGGEYRIQAANDQGAEVPESVARQRPGQGPVAPQPADPPRALARDDPVGPGAEGFRRLQPAQPPGDVDPGPLRRFSRQVPLAGQPPGMGLQPRVPPPGQLLERRPVTIARVTQDNNGDFQALVVPAKFEANKAKTFGAYGWARIDNLTDRRYAGSVIVNEGNGRYFEPAAGRNHVLSVSANYRF